MREFGKAVDLQAYEEPEQDPVEIKVLDRVITIDFPGTGQVTYLSMILASDENYIVRTGGLINFVVNLMEEEDRQYIKRLLLDKHSGFGAEDIEAITEYIIEEWSARPTVPPVDSKPSRRAAGPSSTGATRRAASTRSPSTRRASAT